MKLRNWYRVLGVPETSTGEAIRQAYRRLAKLHHPDHAGAASKREFQQIGQAYSVLSDPSSRRRHDHELAEERSRARQQTADRSGSPVEPLQPPGPWPGQWVEPLDPGPFGRRIDGARRAAVEPLDPGPKRSPVGVSRWTRAPGRPDRARGPDPFGVPCPWCAARGVVRGRLCPLCLGRSVL